MATIMVTSRGTLLLISMTRYCRPNTEWSCGEKLTSPESVGTFLKFCIVAARVLF